MRKQRVELWGTPLFGESVWGRRKAGPAEGESGSSGRGEPRESDAMEAREGEHFIREEVNSVRCRKENKRV